VTEQRSKDCEGRASDILYGTELFIFHNSLDNFAGLWDNCEFSYWGFLTFFCRFLHRSSVVPSSLLFPEHRVDLQWSLFIMFQSPGSHTESAQLQYTNITLSPRPLAHCELGSYPLRQKSTLLNLSALTECSPYSTMFVLHPNCYRYTRYSQKKIHIISSVSRRHSFWRPPTNATPLDQLTMKTLRSRYDLPRNVQ